MTLTIQDLGALGEFFGSIAVLATLIYLALQMRQNTMAISAQVEGARTSSLMTLGLNLVQPGTVEAFVEDLAEESTINDFRRAVSCRVMFQTCSTSCVNGLVDCPDSTAPGRLRAENQSTCSASSMHLPIIDAC